jgi:hypothetical protein
VSARAALALCLTLGACDLDRVIGLSSDPAQLGTVDRALSFTGRDRIDVLLLLDDTSGMSPLHAQLARELPSLLEDLVAGGSQRDVRVGVLTSDLGAPGIDCGVDRGGRLQPVGAAAPAGCQAPRTTPWLSLSAAGDNLPAGQSLAATLTCMTSVGEHGCGFEMPLAALATQLTEAPAGQPTFLRDDALLVVVIVTNEDDCSTPADSDLFGGDPAYGPLTSFRCTRRGVLCGGGLVTDAPAIYEGCRPATFSDGGKLVDLSSYVDLLGRPRDHGGIKADPADVVLAGLYAPPTPFIVGQASGAEQCGAGASSCAALQPSCLSPTDETHHGDPAVRLDTLVTMLGGVSRSICDDSYAPFIADLRARLEAATGGNACIPGALADPRAPDCAVFLGDESILPCDGPLQSGRCWLLDVDPTCPAQVDPRDGTTQQLRMRVLSAPLDAVAASCRVLVAR